MTDLFYMGGPLFMGILTLIFLAVLSTAALLYIKKTDERPAALSAELVKELGLFGLVTGIFGQFIGLFQAFTAIEEAGMVSQHMLMGGLKVSSITTIYGLLICIVAWLLYFGLELKIKKEI